MPTIAYNKRATFDYEIIESYEAGIVLYGHEVKSIKSGHMGLIGSFVVIKNNEAHLLNAYIPPYQPKNIPTGYDPYRSRKLLLRKSEIASLVGKTQQKGLTLIPLRVYTKKSLIKLEIGLAKGKRKEDKREIIKKRESKREIERAMRESFKNYVLCLCN